MRKGYKSVRWRILALLLLAYQPGSLWATEGTARLTLQKTVIDKGKTQIYIIKQGDTISHILQKLGRDPLDFENIRRLNPRIRDLNKIYPGQKLIVSLAVEEPAQQEAKQQTSRNYVIKRGDSVTRIILSELKIKPSEVIKALRLIKSLNPEVKDLNRIYPGQVLKIPDGGEGEPREQPQISDALAVKKDEAKGPVSGTAQLSSPPPIVGLSLGKSIGILGQIIRKLKGAMIVSGNYYIPFPSGEQATIDCAAIPAVELEDGTTVFLDTAGRLPDDFIKMVQSSWQNYYFVKVDPAENVVDLLKKILLSSRLYEVTKVDEPILLEENPRVAVSLDWLITRKATPGREQSRLGLVFLEDKSRLLPLPVLRQAVRRDLVIGQIMAGQMQDDGKDTRPQLPVMRRLKGSTREELLGNVFTFLGLEFRKNQTVTIFNVASDGFNLSIKPELLVKRGDRTVLIHKSKLPGQFTDILREKGMIPFYLAEGGSRKDLLEGVLTALGIPVKFTDIALPEENSRVRVSFSALKIEQEGKNHYLVDFDTSSEVYALLTDYWGLSVTGY